MSVRSALAVLLLCQVACDAFGWAGPSRGRRCTAIGATHPALEIEGVADDVDGDFRHDMMRAKYLDRIGIPADEAGALIAKAETGKRALDDEGMADLQRLLTGHLFSVPFENLDQHSHPADDVVSHVPRKTTDELPSLDVRRSVHKICHLNRGGFCYELNPSFAWLLRSLGFRARLALADPGCSQEIPSHVIVIVDGLMPDRGTSVLVDVGFGNPGVCDVILPIIHNEPIFDTHGDSFRFEQCTQADSSRFDTTIFRRRIVTGNPDEDEPMYRFHSNDDLPYDAAELTLGLDRVLNRSPTFTGKRICVLSTEGGHCTLGENYVKWMARGDEVRKIQFESEAEWRGALSEHFGIVL